MAQSFLLLRMCPEVTTFLSSQVPVDTWSIRFQGLFLLAVSAILPVLYSVYLEEIGYWLVKVAHGTRSPQAGAL